MQDKENRFEKMFAHIAFGLKENLKRPNPEEYRYGLILRQGINMFSALAVEFSGMKSNELADYLIQWRTIKKPLSVHTTCSMPIIVPNRED